MPQTPRTLLDVPQTERPNAEALSGVQADRKWQRYVVPLLRDEYMRAHRLLKNADPNKASEVAAQLATMKVLDRLFSAVESAPEAYAKELAEHEASR